MRQRPRMTRSLALFAALAMLGGTGVAIAPSAEAQNAASQRADRAAGSRVLEGRITGLDRTGRIISVDRQIFLLADVVPLQNIGVGQQVSVTFEETGMGGLRRAIRIAPR